MEEGFRQRAKAVYDLLEDPSTAFVLIASPRRDAVDEALFFASKLGEAGIAVQALVVNRVHPAFGEGLEHRAGPPSPSGSALAELDAVAMRERSHLAALTQKVAPAPTVTVPFLAGDVHDLDGLRLVGAALIPA
jgi:anion-transporting  ArsA/GET3 family ATPase